jgi:hypothetical protein
LDRLTVSMKTDDLFAVHQLFGPIDHSGGGLGDVNRLLGAIAGRIVGANCRNPVGICNQDEAA